MDLERQLLICKRMVYGYLETGDISFEVLKERGLELSKEEYIECLETIKKVIVISRKGAKINRQ